VVGVDASSWRENLMPEIREPLLSERAERLFALEQLHQIGVLDRDELAAMTTAAEIVEVREATPTQSNCLLNGLVLTSGASPVVTGW
jgi:hypothetical protein